MVKIKRKVEMTKKELVQFLIENAEITEITQSTKNGEVFEHCIKIKANNKLKRINDNLVEVEVEEEIYKYTVLDHLYEYTNDNKFKHYKNTPLQIIEGYEDKEFWIKDGDTMTLLWKDGAMVDD